MTPWKQALTRAINAEVAAERAATQAEEERRRTWWATTWALAAAPRAEAGDAVALYVAKTEHSISHAKRRRTTGERLPESRLGTTLPQPRFAMAASDWISKDGDEAKVAEAVKLLIDAERNEQSLREFNQALTGRSWTNAPEDLTEADEDAVVERVARTRPASIGRQAAKPAVAREITENPKAKKELIRAQSERTQRIVKKRREAVEAAGANTKGEMAEAVEAGHAAMNASPDYHRVNKSQNQMISAWIEGIREQRFTPLDRHFYAADLAALHRFVEEVTAFVEADDDPYVAVKQVRAERNEQMQREMDEAEGDTTFDDWDAITRFANEGS